MTDDSNPIPAPPAVPGRYSLAENGDILFQPDASNPLPGERAGTIGKGEDILRPKASDAALQEWLDIHIRTVLEPLFVLKAEGEGALIGPAAEIGSRLYDHLGVIHRSDLEDQIHHLDPDARKALRGKGVRLGPVLAFLPALVKPAAIRLRALLWGLWNGRDLPVARPADGRVSEIIDPETADRNFMRMIGYPVFGPRAIRIDMLDRVVTDVYDSAVQGVFEARNKYAEWLGCDLEGLYAILESMGHRRLREQAQAAPGTPAPEMPTIEQPPAPELPAAPLPAPELPADVAEVVATAAKPAAAPVKFMLKRGKMSERPQPRRPHSVRKERPERKKEPFDPNKPSFKKKREEGEARPKKKYDRSKDRGEREARVYTFEGKKTNGEDDGNPFAILKNLKK